VNITLQGKIGADFRMEKSIAGPGKCIWNSFKNVAAMTKLSVSLPHDSISTIMHDKLC